jgi:hypothetical protein
MENLDTVRVGHKRTGYKKKYRQTSAIRCRPLIPCFSEFYTLLLAFVKIGHSICSLLHAVFMIEGT